MKKIFAVAVAAVFVFGLSAAAWAVAEFEIGASVRTNIQYNVINDDRDAALRVVPEAQGDGFGDFTVRMNNGGRARLYINGELDDFSARFEIREGDGRAIRADRASATWNFAEGMYFLFGFDSDLVDLHWSDAILDDQANYGFGAIGDNKQAQLQLGGSTEMFTWGIDIAEAYDSGLNVGTSFTSEQADFPRFEGIAKFAFGEMFDFGASGWVQSTELINSPTISDEDVQEWGFNGRIRYFSDFVNAGIGGFYSQNAGVSGVSGHPGGVPAVEGTSVEDADVFGAFLTVSFPVEPVTIGAGAGFETASTDRNFADGTGLLAAGALLPEDEWTRWMFYVNVLYNFTDNFFIIPEIQFKDYGDDYENADQGSEWIVGARLQADF
jgi:hypothetical protein